MATYIGIRDEGLDTDEELPVLVVRPVVLGRDLRHLAREDVPNVAEVGGWRVEAELGPAEGDGDVLGGGGDEVACRDRAGCGRLCDDHGVDGVDVDVVVCVQLAACFLVEAGVGGVGYEHVHAASDAVARAEEVEVDVLQCGCGAVSKQHRRSHILVVLLCVCELGRGAQAACVADFTGGEEGAGVSCDFDPCL